MKQIKVNDDVYEKIKSIAEKRQISMADVLEELIQVYMGGETQDKSIVRIIDKDIMLLYDTKCSRCGRELRKGERAHYTKYIYTDNSSKSIVLCLDCYVNQDPLLWKKYLKIKEYEEIARQLKNECERLACELKELDTKVSVARVKKELVDLWRDVEHYIRGDSITIKYEELLSRIDELTNKVSDIEGMLKVSIQAKAKTKMKQEISF